LLFRKRKSRTLPDADSASPRGPEDPGNGHAVRQQSRVSTADTAHLIGPGCVRLVGQVPVWQPVDGSKLQLHPQYLRRVCCYGNVDFTTAVLRLFWRQGIQVVFLSPGGHSLLGKLQPGGKAPNLQRLQHLAADNDAFRLALAEEIVAAKIDGAVETARYYQQQGKGQGSGRAIRLLKRLRKRTGKATAIDQLRGIEGAAAAAWFDFFRSLLPVGWEFTKRVSHPPTDPVNALLSLGYAFVHHRCETLLAAADLDPRVGFLHDVHPGRSSLACDLVEPLRAPLVDRLVVGLLNRKVFTPDSFRQHDDQWRLRQDAFRKFLANFEQAFGS
jgi:CRISPR-associated protein Cas1